MSYSKKLLILGSTGFLGGSIAELFQDSIFEMEVLQPTREKLNLLETDKVQKFINYNKPDLVIHCAAHLPTHSDFKNSRHINNLIDSNIAFALKSISNCRLIYFSGTSVYKSSKEWITEESEVDPTNEYFLSKLDGEMIFQDAGIKTVILRVSAPYGAKQRVKTVLQKFVESALTNVPITLFGNGQRVQNFTYINDVVSAVEQVLLREDVAGIFNICSNHSISMRNLAELLVDITNSKSEIVTSSVIDPDQNTELNFSNQKAKSILSWSPQYDIQSGLIDLLYEAGHTL